MPIKQKNFTYEDGGALAGIRVVDMSRLVCGNVLSLQLADFGADVIKVEPRDGDTLRAWKTRGVEIHWKNLSRNKKSLCVDFRAEGTRDLFREMLRNADVFIESFRPGVLEDIGLKPEDLLEANPKLIIVRISGWGQSGPYRNRPGFGSLIEGMSGFASMTGPGDREPTLPAAALADSVAGLSGAMAVMVALRNVEVVGGTGQVIDLPLFDPLFSILGPQTAQYRLTGKAKQRTGSRSSMISPRNVYKTSDDQWVALAGSTQGMAERIFRAIDRADLVQNPKFSDNSQRLANWQELDEIIAAFVRGKTQAENLDHFVAQGVTVGPIYDASHLLSDAHLQEREVIVDVPDEDMGLYPMTNVIPTLSQTPGTLRRPAPRLGQHTRELLASFGLPAAEIEALLANKTVFADAHGSEDKNA